VGQASSRLLVDLGKGGADTGKAMRKDLPKSGAEAEARAIIEKAIKAQGREDLYAREAPTYYTTRGTLYDSPLPYSYTEENSTQANRFKHVLQVEIGGQNLKMTSVFNGQKGWVKDFVGNTTEVTGKDLEEMTEAVYLDHASRIVCLKDKRFELSPLPEIEVNDKPAVGVKVVSKGHRDINLFFDKKTGLLAKVDCGVMDLKTHTIVNEERIVTEY
jgi:hypothetical protein